MFDIFIQNLPMLTSYFTSLLTIWGIFILVMTRLTLKRSNIDKVCNLTNIIATSVFTIVSGLVFVTLIFPDIGSKFIDVLFSVDCLIGLYFIQVSYSLCLCNFNLLTEKENGVTNE